MIQLLYQTFFHFKQYFFISQQIVYHINLPNTHISQLFQFLQNRSFNNNSYNQQFFKMQRCTYQREQNKKYLMITNSYKNLLCLICYNFCQPLSQLKSTRSESNQKCQCKIHKHEDVIKKMIKYLKQQKKGENMKEVIPIINEILNTKYDNKYLLQYDPQNIPFLEKWVQEKQFLANKKNIKWHGLNQEEIKFATNFFSNIKTYWKFPHDFQYFKKYIDTSSIQKLVTLQNIIDIYRFTNKSLETSTFNQSQIFYSELLNFYKYVYLLKDQNQLQPLEYQALERMNPISRIQIRKNNSKHFRAKYQKRKNPQDEKYLFDPVNFLLFLSDRFLLEYNFRSTGDFQKIYLDVFEMAHLFFKYGILDQQQSINIFQCLYQRIENIKSIENAFCNNNQNKKLKKQWMNGLSNIREIFAQIVLFLLFHKQDSYIEKIILKKQKLQFNNNITRAFFQESTAKKLFDLIFIYFLNDIGQLISNKLRKIIKDLLLLFMKVHDSYIISLNLIKSSQLERYLSSLKNNDDASNNKDIKQIKAIIKQLRDNYLIQTTTFFNKIQPLKILQTLFQKISQLIKYEKKEVSRDEEGSSSSRQIRPQNQRKQQNQQIIKYKYQKILFENNIIGDLMTIYELFYQIMEQKQLIQKFYQTFKVIFHNNGILLPILLNSNILKRFFKREVKNTQKFQFINFILSCFDNQWICAVSHKLKKSILQIYDSFWKNYLKNKQKKLLEQQLIKLINFMKNWQGNFQRDKCFHKYMPTGRFQIMECNMVLLKKILDKSTFCKVMNQQKQSHRLIDALLNRIASCIDGLFTSSFFDDAKNFFTLQFFSQVLIQINNLQTRKNLIIIFENLYINFKENMIRNRQKYETKPISSYIQNSFVSEDYNQIIYIIKKLILHSKQEIQKKNQNPIFSIDKYKKYLCNCIFASNLRFAKYILNLTEKQTQQFAPYVIFFLKKMVNYRQLLQKINQISPTIQHFLKVKQPYDLLAKLKQFKKKLQFNENASYKKKEEALMISNIIKKFFLQMLKQENDKLNFQDRSYYYLNSQKISKFNLSLVSNSIKSRNRAIDDLKKKLNKYKQKLNNHNKNNQPNQNNQNKEDLILFELNTYYLEAKLRRLTILDKNIYLNELRRINQSRQIQLSDSSIILKNFANFIVKYLDFSDQKKRDQIFNVIELFCNILYFVTQPFQNQLYQIFKKRPQIIKNMWQQIIRSWNFIINKAVLNLHWKYETERLIILLRFNQFLIQDNNLKLKNFFGETLIRQKQNLTITELVYQLQAYMIQRNQWNVSLKKDCLEMYNDRNRIQLFKVAFQLREFINEIVIGPNYRNIELLQKKGYEPIIKLLSKYNVFNIRQGDTRENNKDPLSILDPLSTYKYLYTQYLFTILQGYHKVMYDKFQNSFSVEFLQTIYCNCIKLVFYYQTDPKSKQKIQKPITQLSKLTKLTQFQLKMEHLQTLLQRFKETQDFSSHNLIKLCSKIYSIIQMMSFKKSTAAQNFVRQRIQQIKKYKQSKNIQLPQEKICCYQFLSQITLSIEIIRYYTPQEKQFRNKFELENKQKVTNIDKQIIVYYFKKSGAIVYLSKQSKNNFIINVDRNSGQSKNNAILEQSKSFCLQIKHNKANYKKKFGLFTMIENIYIFQFVSFLMSLFINIIYIVDQIIDSHKTILIAFILSIIQIILTAIFYVLYAIFRLPLDYQINKGSYKLQCRIKKTNNEEKFKIFRATVIYNSSFALLLYLIFTLLSLIKKQFIVFNLLLSINLNKTATYVLKSITKYRYQLICTYIFGLIIVYILTFIAYLKFSDAFMVQYASASDESPQNQNQLIKNIDPNEKFCNGMFSCYLNVVNNAIRSNSGIGQLQYAQSYHKSHNYWQSFVLSLIFFYLINVIMNNVIFGIIINTFKDLRDQQRKFQEDKKTRCFICNIQKNKFQSQKIDFYKHKKIDHNQWNYVYFLYSLQKKTYRDCSATQHYLKKEVQKNSIAWMPLNESIQLNTSKQRRKNNRVREQATQSQNLIKFKKMVKQIMRKSIQNLVNKTLQSQRN